MPPASKKDCSVILFDLATKSRELSLQALMKICCNNFFSGSKDLTKLVLVNSDTTDNRLNAHYGGYEHINEIAKDVMVYHPRLLLEMIEGSGLANANWLEGLLVAVKNLSEEFESIGGIVTLQLLFITDLSQPLEDYNRVILDEIIEDINKMQAFVYIIGPDIEVPFTIKTSDHVKQWMNNLQVDEDNQNLNIVKEIVTNTKNTIVCDFRMGVHLFFSYRNWGGSQPWQVPLSVGSKVHIPAQTMKILNQGMQCKLTSKSTRTGDTVWIDAEDEQIEIDPGEVRCGIMRHEKFIIIEDNKMFQVENPRSFSVLCFTDSTNVPEYLMCGEGCYCVLPNGTPDQNEAMTTLIDCLAQQNKYVIARRVYNNNYVPKIVVLVPKPEHNPKCFYLTSLPYAEDVRYPYTEKPVSSAPKTEVCNEVYNFLDSINIEKDSCEKKVPLAISMMLDTNTQKLVGKAANKFLEKYMRLEELDLDYVTESTSGPTVDALKNIWPERKLNEVKKNKEDNADDDSASDNDFDW